jgi:hypothetical protein
MLTFSSFIIHHSDPNATHLSAETATAPSHPPAPVQPAELKAPSPVPFSSSVPTKNDGLVKPQVKRDSRSSSKAASVSASALDARRSEEVPMDSSGTDPRKLYKNQKRTGKGGFGSVFEAKRASDGMKVGVVGVGSWWRLSHSFCFFYKNNQL